ncbi:MAG TPA: TraR/DksA family transcriptional regulator [Candidatus Eisenbacteria bacterium]|nr:TraR/DksA family transcriptional regulator [Candidatus Eisenbacteria bacterium]
MARIIKLKGSAIKKSGTKGAAKRKLGGLARPSATASAILGKKAMDLKLLAAHELNPKWVKHYRRLLTWRERVLKVKMGLAKDAVEETPVYGMDMADAATDEFDRALALSKLTAEQDALYEIEAAIKRVHQNTYGICELTGKPIPEARLAAIPWTRFTAQAESQLERQGAVSHTHLGAVGSVHGLATGTLEGSELIEDKEAPSAKDEELWPFYSLPGSRVQAKRK